jgi:hypothetical protein
MFPVVNRYSRITPPLDDDEENEESRLQEDEARKRLEVEGCPPCYPSNVDIRRPPERYRTIIGYWQSFPGTDDNVLCAQLADWQRSRASQRRDRKRHRDKHFDQFVEQVRRRLHRHGVSSDVHLFVDLEQQNQLEHWTEFQNYHLQRFEQFEKKRGKLTEEYNSTLEIARNTDNAESKRAVENAEAIQNDLECTQRDMARHEDLLQWIEHCRRVMRTGILAPAEAHDSTENHTAPETLQRVAIRHSRTRKHKAAAALGQVRISEPKPKKPNTKDQKLSTLKLKPVRRIPQSQACQRKNSWHTKTNTLLFQPDSRSVSRISTLKVRTDCAKRTRCAENPRFKRSSTSSSIYKTRSGRISKPPERWI